MNPTYHYMQLLVGICIIILNSFVIVLFTCKKSLHKLPGNYILVSLSVNDFLNGVAIILKLIPIFYLSGGNCVADQETFRRLDIPSLFRAFYRVLMLSSVLHLICLSTDRIMYVAHALKYNKIITRRRVLRMIALLWVLCCLLGGIQLLWTMTSGPWRSNRMEFRLYYAVVLSVFIILIPSIVLLVQSATMVKIIRRLDASRRREPRQMAGKKAFFLYTLMYVQFVIFSYPYFIFTFVYVLKESFTDVPVEMIETFLFIRFLPCLFNPFLYTLNNRDYRTALRDVIRKFKKSFLYRTPWYRRYTLNGNTVRLTTPTESPHVAAVTWKQRKSMNQNSIVNGFRRKTATSKEPSCYANEEENHTMISIEV